MVVCKGNTAPQAVIVLAGFLPFPDRAQGIVVGPKSIKSESERKESKCQHDWCTCILDSHVINFHFLFLLRSQSWACCILYMYTHIALHNAYAIGVEFLQG